MDPQILDWINLNLKWIHLIVGIAWIGASFYFNWLEGNLERNKPGLPAGVAGDLWSVHGGGFYHVQKYEVAPETLPKVLHWFKWEAYFTWITGMLLLLVVFYLNPSLSMIDPGVAELSPALAVVIGLGSLLIGWLVYDWLCKSPLGERPVAFFIVIFLFLTLTAWVLTQLLSPRAAFLHVGAMIGTIMAANVFFGIIPSQKAMVEALENGREPDGKVGKLGFQRSLHNNYFTLPVLFIMISGHYPMTFAAEYNWLILAAIALIGVFVRHYFNLKNRGKLYRWMLPAAAVLMALLAYLTYPKKPDVPPTGSEVGFESIAPIMAQRCASCHAQNPSDPAFAQPPKGVSLETRAQIEGQADAIYAQTVLTHAMPIGNLTGMTEEERNLLNSWYLGLKK
ncbi:urate hydroxylase PuuD [Thiomicrorhabdus sp.]|uniref:urate hydroxylase PuuD n=1 Tax=Thiomicrorhabdus sp. TaxID=2039724 RepID=UPI0029C794AD|nr:urate hydroxylase PuuD [Thiomicrorhabdus sp.]